MRASHLPAALLIAGGLSALAAPAAAGAPPAGAGNCVSNCASPLGKAGVAGSVISGGAHARRPFGRNAVSPEAHAPLDACPFVPEDFLP